MRILLLCIQEGQLDRVHRSQELDKCSLYHDCMEKLVREGEREREEEEIKRGKEREGGRNKEGEGEREREKEREERERKRMKQGSELIYNTFCSAYFNQINDVIVSQ